MMTISRPSGARRTRRIKRPFSSATVMMRAPSGRSTTVVAALLAAAVDGDLAPAAIAEAVDLVVADDGPPTLADDDPVGLVNHNAVALPLLAPLGAQLVDTVQWLTLRARRHRCDHPRRRRTLRLTRLGLHRGRLRRHTLRGGRLRLTRLLRGCRRWLARLLRRRRRLPLCCRWLRLLRRLPLRSRSLRYGAFL